MKLLTFAAAMALAAPAAAGDMLDTCSHASELAATIMEHRQAGVTAADSMKAVLPLVPSQSRGLMQRIILSAYEHPHYRTPENQRRAVTDFQDSVFVSCMAG